MSITITIMVRVEKIHLAENDLADWRRVAKLRG